MIELELLNETNEHHLLNIQRDDIPEHFVEDVSYTIRVSQYGKENNLKGHCYAIKYKEQYVGIVLIGEAIEDEVDPSELKGKVYFRLIGFVIDKQYRGLGIGSEVLEKVIQNIYDEYGRIPILLECHKENIGAINFYTKLGFRNTYILHNQDYYMIKD